MKKFNYFLLTMIFLFVSTIHLNAFTTTVISNSTIQQIELLVPLFQESTNLEPAINAKTLESNELQVSAASSSELITNNLNLLYSICIALVLFNLVVQIKIIVQMIHLFFLFQKKDEFAGFDFR